MQGNRYISKFLIQALLQSLLPCKVTYLWILEIKTRTSLGSIMSRVPQCGMLLLFYFEFLEFHAAVNQCFKQIWDSFWPLLI